MKDSLKVLLLAVPLCFLLGAWWGYHRVQVQVAEMRGPQESLRFLSMRGFLPAFLVRDFEKEHEVRVKVTEMDNELDLLNEIYSNPQAYDLVQLKSYQAKFLINANSFRKIDKSKLRAWPQVSVDFKNLNYDLNNDFLIPIQWGLTLHVFKRDKFKDRPKLLKTLLEDKEFKGHLAFKADSVEIFEVLRRQGISVEQWVRTENAKALDQSIKNFLDKVVLTKSPAAEALKNDEVWMAQEDSGKTAQLLNEMDGLRRWVPKEKSTLWVHLLGISREAEKPRLARELIDYLLQPKVAKKMVERTQQATVLDSLNTDSEIHAEQKASYLRQLELGGLDLVVEHLAFQPIWNKSIGPLLSEALSKAEEDKKKSAKKK